MRINDASSVSLPAAWRTPWGRKPDWNRTVERIHPEARGAVLLLHGVSDSPYSMRAMAQLCYEQGFNVLALRLPGHGLAPAGLLRASLSDWNAAVRLGMRHLANQLPDHQPLYIVGYSTGASLAVELTYEPKEASPAYAQIIVQTETLAQISRIWPKVEQHMRDNYPHLDPIIKAFRIGPGRDGKIEARFHGPDPTVLRSLAERAKAIMRADPGAKEINDDWRQPARLVRPVFNERVASPRISFNQRDGGDQLTLAAFGYLFASLLYQRFSVAVGSS